MSETSSDTPAKELSTAGTEQPPALSAEEVRKQRLRDQLVKGRATRKANIEARKAAATDPHKVPDNAIAATSVQVPGALLTIKDGQGHTWTVPAESNEDHRRHRSVFDVRAYKGHDPNFAYQFIRRDEINSMLTSDWVPVSRKELGITALPAAIAAQYGTTVDSNHWVNDQVCIKKPKVLADREYNGWDRFCREVANSMKPATTDRVEAARQHLEQGGLVNDEVNQITNFQEPR